MPNHAEPIRILIVDDSRDFLEAACAWVDRQSGLLLAGTAGDGREAEEAVRRWAPDLVLMDAFMPGRDGFETTRRIKAEPGTPRVVMLSVHDGLTVENEAWAAGADGFVPKANFVRRLPEVIKGLFSSGGRPDAENRPGKRGVDPVDGERKKRPGPSAGTECSRVEPAKRIRKWEGFRTLLTDFGNRRRPVGLSAEFLTEGGTKK